MKAVYVQRPTRAEFEATLQIETCVYLVWASEDVFVSSTARCGSPSFIDGATEFLRFRTSRSAGCSCLLSAI